MKKARILSFITAIVMILMMATVADADWKKEGKKWRYYTSATTYIKNQWKKIDGEYYRFDKKGYRVTGWYKDKKGTYYLTSKGIRVTGWRKIGSKKYYFDKNGKMATGWKSLNGKKYYFEKKGKMVTGWKKINGSKYYFNNKGHMLTGWQTIKSLKYYFTSKGQMVTGWNNISGNDYFFDDSGILTKTKSIETEANVPIPFETEYQYDDSMLKTAPEIVIQQGADGYKTITWEVIRDTNGSEISRTNLDETVMVSPIPMVIKRGTRDASDSSYTIVISEKVTIPFETTYITDTNSYIDQETVITPGANGTKEVFWKVIYVNGAEISRAMDHEAIINEPVNQVISRGTKQHVILQKQEVTTTVIPYTTEYTYDETKYEDDPEVILQQGKNGVKTETWSINYTDGVETSRSLISTSITDPLPQKIARGSRKHVTTQKIVQETVVIPFTTSTEENPMAIEGTTITQDGLDGEKIITYRKTYKDGVETGSEVISETVTKEMVPGVTYIGTAKCKYEYVTISLPNVNGSRSDRIDEYAKILAMTLAENNECHHFSRAYAKSIGYNFKSGYLESVGCFSETDGIGQTLVEHTSDLKDATFWGVGCVRKYAESTNGLLVFEEYYAMAVGGEGFND